MRCIECNGRVIEDREQVCEDCGLVQGPILQACKAKDPGLMYRNTNESIFRKEGRERKMVAKFRVKEISKIQEKEDFITIQVDRKAHAILKTYCKKQEPQVFVRDIVSELIWAYINKEAI